jgi:RNA polymerase sigma-70 factor (ECF subfamily)
MDADSLHKRLSQISTAWSLLARAHGGPVEPEAAALTALVERYQAAVYRYLLAATRDPDVADELFQEFALRLVRGDFGRVDAARGRFRDYVKSALINLVINHKKKRRLPVVDAAMAEPAAQEQPFDADVEFVAEWRKALLDRTWEALAGGQAADGPPFHAVLRYRSEHPELSGAELAEHLNARLQPAAPFSGAALRKLLQRARDRFADLLLEEAARSLGTTSVDAIEQELIDLGLADHCKRALERRREPH